MSDADTMGMEPDEVAYLERLERERLEAENAGGGVWERETGEWQEAAQWFRTEYHSYLADHRPELESPVGEASE